MKLRRILAWIIDWNLCGIPVLLCSLILRTLLQTQELTAVYALFSVLVVVSFPVLFVVRDVLFKGRSVAKRIFKLRVIDNATNELPKNKKLIIRNLFFFLYLVEAILLIATNKSIGDMVTNTTVVRN